MPDTLPFDVFLSHSSKDKAIVRDIAARLAKDGVRVWFDEEQIKPGDHIGAKIDEGLENSRVLVFCMSSHSMGSDWAQVEYQTFRFRDPLNKERRFLPLRLDQSPIKSTLAPFLYLDWNLENRENIYTQLLESCGREQQIQVTPRSRDRFVEKIHSLGHTSNVWSVAWSPDGLRVLSGANDNTIRLWGVESGLCLRVLEGHIASVHSVAWSPDGLYALSGSSDCTVRLWEVTSGLCLRVFEGHTVSVKSVAWSPDGLRALSGSEDRTVRMWEVGSGLCLRVFEGEPESVKSVAWSPDGLRALSGGADKTVRVWEIESGRCLRVLKGHTDIVFSVAWSPDGLRALSGAADKTVRMWEIESGRCLRVLKGHTNHVYSVAWSPNGLRAVSGAADQIMRIWDLASGLCLCKNKGHIGGVYSVAWSPNGLHTLSGAGDKTMRMWEVASGNCLDAFAAHIESVLSTAWSSDGQLALSGASDKTIRLWEVSTGRCVRVFVGHTGSVWSVAWSPDGRFFASGGEDQTVRLWDASSDRCLRKLVGHSSRVWSVAWSPDGKRVLSGAADQTMRMWEVESGRCLRESKGHTASVTSVAWSPDGQHILSGADDKTIRLWEMISGRCLRVLSGHTASVNCVTWSPDGKLAVSGAPDKTVRLWEIKSGRCLRVLEGHTARIRSVAWSPDGLHAVSGAADKTVRLWEVKSGRCLHVLEEHTDSILSVSWLANSLILSAAGNGVMGSWHFPSKLNQKQAPAQTKVANPYEVIEYTNAKVLVVGDTHAGKTALTHRLATGNWKPSDESTVGAWSTQWALKDTTTKDGEEREIWLWDFGGQADQRLIHQLYLEGSALVLQLFDADQEDVLPGLRDWQTALQRCVKEPIPHFLVAGRIDTGFKASKGKIKAHATEQKMKFFETSAKDGTGCDELRKDLITSIPWDQMTKRTSPRIFKLIKDEILKLRDNGQVLHTFKELREELWQRLSGEPRFSDEILRTVLSLLDGPGVVKELDYGTYILLVPEWINAYAQAVIRTLRNTENDLGALPLRSIAEGKLIYQSIGRDGAPGEMKRLPLAEERVVLGEMERQLEQRSLCLRQGDKLVFPSHCGRDRPAVLEHPSTFVSYAVKGFLDDIYATLVVKLADSESFKLQPLWRDAADFVTLVGEHHMGIKLTRASASEGDIGVYFGKGVTQQEQVIFANYIHAHLEATCESAPRRRHYVCPKCHAPKGNAEVLMKKLIREKQSADTECDNCGNRFPLWDALEKRFASETVRKQVEELQADDLVQLTTRRQGKLLVLEIGARITSANQKWFEIPTEEDDGIDIQMEFTDESGNGVGKGLCLQLKAGNSFLTKRKTDEVEVFQIKKQRWLKTWMNQPFPVMLVIGTLTEDRDLDRRGDKRQFESIRWMEITSVLKRLSENGTKPVKQIEFKGEEVNMTTVMQWRKRVIGEE